VIRDVLTIPGQRSVLRSRSLKVRPGDPTLAGLIHDLVDTWTDAHAYGLSAPQLGVLQRVLLYRQEDGTPAVVVNPKVISVRGEEKGYDGCLSIPGIYGTTRRPEEVEFTGEDQVGQRIRRKLKAFTARIFLHELDHLEGVLFIDRLDSLDDLYTLERNDQDESEEVALSAADRRFVAREQRPLPTHLSV
jgi:peptide deformylase